MQKNTLVPKAKMVVWAGLALLPFFNVPAAFGNSLGVINTNDSGPGSLRNAIASASSGDTIYFNPKAMRLPATITLASTLFINQSLTILGPGPSLLFISGGNAVGVFSIGSLGVSISGLTIQNGSANAGGGILNQGTLTLSNCALIGNSAGGGAGGAIFNGRPSPGFDAAGSQNAAPLTINNCTLSGNSAGIGGAIYNQLIALTLSGSTLSGNSASAGGGIYNFGTVTISNSTLSGNSASGGGGGIYTSGTLTISSSTLSGNSGGAGGGIDNSFGTLTLGNSTLSGNSATINGGGIYNQSGTLTLSDGTLSGNSSPVGGAIYSSGSPQLKNTILANSASGGNCSVASGTLTSLGYNLSDDTTCATFFNQPGDMNSTGAGLDPAGLNSNGGPTQTIALLPASPAVDAIPVSACTDVAGSPVTTDQRGAARPQGRACDIGAFELVPQGMPIPLARLQ